MGAKSLSSEGGLKREESEESRKEEKKERKEGKERRPHENPTRVRRPRENPSMVGISLGLLGPPATPCVPYQWSGFRAGYEGPPWGILVKINGFIIGIANKSVPEGGIRLYPQGKRYSSTGKHHSTKW